MSSDSNRTPSGRPAFGPEPVPGSRRSPGAAPAPVAVAGDAHAVLAEVADDAAAALAGIADALAWRTASESDDMLDLLAESAHFHAQSLRRALADGFPLSDMP
ncbi:MAG: hypothetical protein IJ087_12160 [Eggerthellaceae bacterium]|nr:hypothetical protein [Eggerthellaceae bacterium]